MNSFCVNYNWNGQCVAPKCHKKHFCVSCGEKHPARICSKQCMDYNWAKCSKYCPKNKQHSCSQCGDSKHPAWRCQYLHKCVTERYYFIYKSKKLKNGYFKLQENKLKQKNILWINRKKPAAPNNNNYDIQQLQQQQQHHYQQKRYNKHQYNHYQKRSNRK